MADACTGASEREPLVLLPGHLCDARIWAHQVDALADIADPMVPALDAHDSVAGLAADVLLRAPPRFALAGFSLGGFVALEIIRRASHRVSRLALIGTSARPDAPELAQVRLRNMADAAKSGLDCVLQPFLLSMAGPVATHESGLMAAIVQMMHACPPALYMAQQQAIMTRPDARAGLRDIAVPTLVLAGAADPLAPPDVVAELTQAIPRAARVTIREAGHMLTMEQPVAISACLRYWMQI